MIDNEKKTQILQAATKLFAYYGYEKTTLEEIGNLAGLNKTSLYYYYKNKETIYIDVIRSETGRFLSRSMASVNDINGCTERVLFFLKELRKYPEGNVNLQKLAIEMNKGSRPGFNQLSMEIMEIFTGHLAGILENGVKAGEIKSCDSRKVARSIITVAQAIENRKFNCIDSNLKENVDYSEIGEEINFTISLILDGLLTKKQAN